jgi:hypothetical protein
VSTDSIFEFNSKKYIIKTREFFDENVEISHAALWSKMGYEDWTKKSMSKITDFLNDYDFSRFIIASLIDNKHIKINSDTGWIQGIDKTRKIIYYNINSDKNPNSLFDLAEYIKTRYITTSINLAGVHLKLMYSRFRLNCL